MPEWRHRVRILSALCIGVVIAATLCGCSVGDSASPKSGACEPTVDDGLSPSYRADSPVRTRVGSGHLLTGVVRSSADCSPIAGAKVELWPEYAGRGHPDSARATVFTDSRGAYRFECEQPEHIHMQISAPGYITIAQNSYHPEGSRGRFDVTLAPIAE